MCGISGIAYNHIQKETDKFKKSADLQSHRGPDYTGYYGDDAIDLIHHRLSIIDLDKRSHQPFTDSESDRILIYNGEIYNFKDLSSKYDLELSTTSDTEVLYKLLRNNAFNLNELNGIFAFAEYNKSKNTLRLVRDRLGIKPLYYYKDSKHFIFASEAKVIYDFLEELSLNYQALSEFLYFGHSNGEQTIINGVKKVIPGTSLILDLESFELSHEVFWDIEELAFRPKVSSYDEAKNKTKDLLEKAIQRQCISDVPVGAYLSGGIDSSAVVSIASKYTNRKLMTYSVDFDMNEHSELNNASRIAKKYNTEHYEFQVNLNNVDSYLSNLVFQYDEPFSDPAMIPLHLIAEKASKSSRVVLQGDGGDEIFAGYGRHLDLLQYKKRKNIFNILRKYHPSSSQRKHFLERFNSLNYNDRSKLMANLVPSDINFNFNQYNLNPELLQNTKPLIGYEKSYAKFKSLTPMNCMLFTDIENILQHKFLDKVDKINMYHSIEARVPLLDNDLIDYALTLEDQIKIKKSTTKYFLRDVVRDYLPNEILQDRKRSFGTPIGEWLRTSLYSFTRHQFEMGSKKNYPFNYQLLIKDLDEYKNKGKKHLSNILWKYLIITIWFSFYDEKITDFK